MNLRNGLRVVAKALSASPEGLLTLQTARGGLDPSAALAFQGTSMFGFPRSSYVNGYFFSVQNASYGMLYETQPAVRTVVDHLAANFLQIPMHMYAGVVESDRRRDTTHPLVDVMARPNEYQLGAELLHALAVDFLVYDNAYLVIVRNAGGSQPYQLVRVPAYAMGVRGANRLYPDGYQIVYADGTAQELEPNEVVHWRGTNGVDPRVGWSRLETLRQVLISESVRQAADIEFSRNGRVKGGIILRPAEAPDWSPEAMTRFEESFAQRVKEVNRGRSPILEEGMTWIDAGVTPAEAQAADSQRLALATVCQVYGLHPAIFGVYESEQNLAEARAQESIDVVPPLLRSCALAMTRGLIVNLFNDGDRYFEFDMNVKLQGDVETLLRSAIISTGAPFVTRNEARSLFGYGPIDGGDDLITPLNVLQGTVPSSGVMPPQHATSGAGQAPEPTSPAASAPAPKADAAEPTLKAQMVARRKAMHARRDEYAVEYAGVYRRHVRRQVAAARANKAAPDFASARWNEELAADLHKVMKAQVAREGEVTSARLMGTFDYGHVENYVKAAALARAERFNHLTQARYDSAAGALVKADPIDAVNGASTQQSDNQGDSTSVSMANFAVLDAAVQNPGEHGLRQKVWVDSHLPDSRLTHKALDNEHMLVGQPFTNGLRYPGDPLGSPEETANCRCLLDVI